jgi:hypothetical protein
MPGRARLIVAIAIAVAAIAAGTAGATAPAPHRLSPRCGCETGGPPPPPTPHQAISVCRPVKLRHSQGWLEVSYGYYTTTCPAARLVVATFWPHRRLRHGRVGSWTCTRYPKSHAVECHGPKRAFAEGFWVTRIV